MTGRLPAFSSLRAFEAAARLGAFTQAADELGISQSAVTRQIESLEAGVGTMLFHRGRRGVSLTLEGRAYFEEIAPAFELIRTATTRLWNRGVKEPLKLRVYPTFASKWLIPRLVEFKSWAPSVDVKLDTSVKPVNFERDNVDAAIQFGAGDRTDLHSEFLIADEIEPVCSPALRKGKLSLEKLDDLRQLTILTSHYRRDDWRDWLIEMGRRDLLDIPSVEFPSSILAYQAAEEGLGVAMGQTVLLKKELAAGALVRPFSRSLKRKLGYFLLTPKQEPPARVRSFRAWLLNALKE